MSKTLQFGRVRPRKSRQLIAESYSEHLGIRYLAQGYLGSAPKVSWHISCYQHTFQCLTPGIGPSQPSPLQTELPPPQHIVHIKNLNLKCEVSLYFHFFFLKLYSINYQQW